VFQPDFPMPAALSENFRISGFAWLQLARRLAFYRDRGSIVARDPGWSLSIKAPETNGFKWRM
jgi:hypothetical protein